MTLCQPLAGSFMAAGSSPTAALRHTVYRAFLLLLLWLLGAAAVASGQTVNFGTTASTTGAGNRHFLSDGSQMQDNLFHFQVGYFDTGFVAADPSTWLANWRVYDDASSGGIEGQDSFNAPVGLSPFGYNMAGSLTNTLSSFNGQQGYIWGFNDQGLTGMAGGEAVLFTHAGWTFPNVGSLDAVDWTADGATSVLWGAIDTNDTGLGGQMLGSGERSTPMPENSYHVQSAGFAVVPEPSSALCVGLAGMLALIRRRRLVR